MNVKRRTAFGRVHLFSAKIGHMFKYDIDSNTYEL